MIIVKCRKQRNRFAKLLVVIAMVSACGRSYCSQYDIRSLPETATLIATTASSDIAPDEQIVAISRAIDNGEAYDCADIYEAIANKEPTNALAQLYAGVADEETLLYGATNGHVFPPPHDLSQYELEGNTFLAAAYKLQPSVPLIESEFGFWLWQTGVDQQRGFALTKDAAAKSSELPVLMNLASIYAVEPPKDENLGLAKSLLLEVVRLEPDYGLGHWLLWSVDCQLNDQGDASAELAIAHRLWLPLKSLGPRAWRGG